MKEKNDNIDFMVGVLQEFTEIMFLVDSFKSLSSDCLGGNTLFYLFQQFYKNVFVNAVNNILNNFSCNTWPSERGNLEN